MSDGDLVVRVHKGIDDDGRDTWDVTLDGPAGSVKLLHEAYSEEEAERVAADFQLDRKVSGDADE